MKGSENSHTKVAKISAIEMVWPTNVLFVINIALCIFLLHIEYDLFQIWTMRLCYDIGSAKKTLKGPMLGLIRK